VLPNGITRSLCLCGGDLRLPRVTEWRKGPIGLCDDDDAVSCAVSPLSLLVMQWEGTIFQINRLVRSADDRPFLLFIIKSLLIWFMGLQRGSEQN